MSVWKHSTPNQWQRPRKENEIAVLHCYFSAGDLWCDTQRGAKNSRFLISNQTQVVRGSRALTCAINILTGSWASSAEWWTAHQSDVHSQAFPTMLYKPYPLGGNAVTYTRQITASSSNHPTWNKVFKTWRPFCCKLISAKSSAFVSQTDKPAVQNCDALAYSTSVKQNKRMNSYDPPCSQHWVHYGTWPILINFAGWSSQEEHCLTNKHRTAHSISTRSYNFYIPLLHLRKQEWLSAHPSTDFLTD